MENKQLYEKQSNQYNPFFPIVRLDDIIETISDKSIQWILNNYNHIYVEYSESVSITRNKVPSLLRRNGLWISYNTGKDIITEWYKGKNVNINDYNQWTDDANWAKFEPLADGKVTYQHLSHALKQLIGKGNNITNFPDEEDITTDGIVLSFKDREYDTNNFSGLGKLILRKNIILDNGVYKNVLTQDMINKSNTIYEIRYDFDLNGAEITIPEGCVLDFQGGSFSNGTIIGNETIIRDTLSKIFGLDITIQGTFNVDFARPEWFGAKPDSVTDSTDAFQKVVDSFLNVKLSHGCYKITKTIIIKYCFTLFGSTLHQTYSRTIIEFHPTDNTYTTLFSLQLDNNTMPYMSISDILMAGPVPVVENAVYKEGSVCIDITIRGTLNLTNCYLQNFETLVKSNFNSYYNKFINNNFENAKYCLYNMSNNNILIKDNRFKAFQHGVLLHGDGPSLIIGNSFEQFCGHIIYFPHRANACNFISNYVELYDTVKLPALFTDNNNGYYGGNTIFYGDVRSFTSIGNEFQINGAKIIYYFNNIVNFVSINNHIKVQTKNCNIERYFAQYLHEELIKQMVCLDYLDRYDGGVEKYNTKYLGTTIYTDMTTINNIVGNDPFTDVYLRAYLGHSRITPNIGGGWWFDETSDLPYIAKTIEGYYLFGKIKRRVDLATEASDLLLNLSIPKFGIANNFKIRFKTFNSNYEDVILVYEPMDGSLRIEHGSKDYDIYLDGIVIRVGY